MKVLSNVNAWKAKSEAQRKRVAVTATEHVKSRALALVKEAVKVSPQFTGNYAYNWQLLVGKSMQGQAYWSDRGRKPGFDWKSVRNPRSAGDMTNMEFVIQDARDQLSYAKWNSVITLVNASPVADDIETHKVHLRASNRIFIGSQGVFAYLKSKHPNLEYK